jgi:TonB-dependent receptor
MSTPFISRSLRSLLLAGAAFAAPLHAETADAAPEEIVVTGSRPIAESEAAALKAQKESPALVSVVASDAVGRLPDQNIAQAISRLPGVGVERDQGQARYVNLRGAPRSWATLSFDGITVVSPEGRDSRYDSIPSAIASQVVVRKAVTPDMTGETIAGNVDVITRSAFDYDGFRFAGKGGVGYVDLGNRTEYEAAAVVSNRFETGAGEIGILASASYYRRGLVTDNFETDWEQVTQDQRPGFADRVWPRETENKLYRSQRLSYSASGRIDWEPSVGNRVFVSSIYSAFADDELRNNYIYDLDDQQGRVPTLTAACPTTGVQPPAANTTGYADVCTGNTPFLGTVHGIDINANIRIVDYVQSVFTNTIGGDHEAGDWKVRWRGNYTKSVDDRSQPALIGFESPGFGTNGATATGRPTVVYDLTDRNLSKVELYRTLRSPTGVLSRGARVTNIEDFALPLARFRSLDARDTTNAYTGRLELEREFASTTVKVGAQYDNRNKTARERLLDLNLAQATTAGVPLSLQAYTKDGAFQGDIPLGYTFRYFDKDIATAAVDRALASGLTRAPVNANFYDVTEEIWSAYAMATTKVDWGSIVYGARVEHIRNDSRAFAQTGLVNVRSDRTLVYPSLHFNWDVTDEHKIRLSFNTGAARPDYDELRPNFTFNDANRTVSGGNPTAKPEKAKGIDLYYEYYIAPQGYFSVGGYYKDVKDALFNVTQTFGLDVLNAAGVDRSQYVLSTIGNGGDGKVYGIEGAVQLQLDPFIEGSSVPAWLGGFGISANVTLTDSEATTPDGRKVRFPGTSDVLYNLSGYYEKYGVSLRASYQKRTAWIDAIGSAADGGDFFWAADDELDVSARYAISENFEVYFDAANLLNGPGRRFVGTSARTLEFEKFGARYTGGVRVTF